MNIVDSCGWLEYFSGGGNANFFAQPLLDVDHLLVPTICLYGVFKVVDRQRGKDAALQATALLHQGREIALSSEMALYAAELSQEFSLPMADAIIYASARLHSALVWTQDQHFAGLTGVQFIEKV